MLNITKLQKSAESALAEAFSEKCKSIKDIEVFDHTEEIFEDDFEGVAVWCDVNRKALSWFDGNPSFIISYSKELCEGNIDLFLGDEYIDTDAAMDAADEFCCDDVWHIEQIDDFLMLQASFTLDTPDTLEENIAKKLKMLEDSDFVEAIQPVISYFE
jgi:hypothetical protein